MKIRLAQMHVAAGDLGKNFSTCQSIINQAKADDVDLLVLPEFCLSGLFVDKFDMADYLFDYQYFANQIADLSDNRLSIVFNYVTIDKLSRFMVAQNGKALVVCQNPIAGKVSGRLRISENINLLLTSTDNLDSLPNSDSNSIVACFNHAPFVLDKADYTLNSIEHFAQISKYPTLYINNVGLENQGKVFYSFDGRSAAFNRKGEFIAQAPIYQPATIDVDFEQNDFTNSPILNCQNYSEVEYIYHTLKNGIKEYMNQCGLQKVVIGASGGIDSAVSAAIFVETIGAENVTLVNMPTRFNSQTTIGLAKQLANNLGCYYCSVPVEDSMNLTKAQINGLKATNPQGNEITFELSKFNVENVQARDRSSRILAAIASAWGGVFTNNGNKTETSIGYATLYGDVAGFMCALADLWKFQVYALGRYINKISKTGEKVPQAIFEIKPSAELSEEQSLDAGKGDPLIYPYHDRLLRAWQEWENPAGLADILQHFLNGDLAIFLNNNQQSELSDDIIKKNFTSPQAFVKDLERWWKLFNGMAVAKRIQAPPIVAVSRRPYGSYPETMGTVFFSQKYLCLKKKLGIE